MFAYCCLCCSTFSTCVSTKTMWKCLFIVTSCTSSTMCAISVIYPSSNIMRGNASIFCNITFTTFFPMFCWIIFYYPIVFTLCLLSCSTICTFIIITIIVCFCYFIITYCTCSTMCSISIIVPCINCMCNLCIRFCCWTILAFIYCCVSISIWVVWCRCWTITVSSFWFQHCSTFCTYLIWRTCCCWSFCMT